MIQTFIIIAGITLTTAGIMLYTSQRNRKNKNSTEWDVLDFIEQNPHRSSVYFTKNDEVLAASTPKQAMPVVSIVNMIITIEYTRQVSNGFIDKDQIISLSDIKLYDIPRTDGGAYTAWEESMQKRHMNTIHQDKVRLHDVVQGMIHYHSNANTAFLLDVLDLHQLNRTLRSLNVDIHENIYYFTASSLLPAYLHVEESLSKRKVKQKLKDMPIEDFKAYSGIIHGLLKHRQAHDLIQQAAETTIVDAHVQKLIFDRFPKGTVEEYGHLMRQIYTTEYFTPDRLTLFKDLLQREPMEQESTWRYFGGIGGSTPFTNNYIIYGITEQKQHRFIFGVCTKDLSHTEAAWMREEMGTFISRSLADASFQEALVKRLT